jgi:hypothetical protein
VQKRDFYIPSERGEHMKRIGVVGSRDWRNMALVRTYIDALPQDTMIVSGGARGVDSAAAGWARERGLKVSVIPADWNTYGKAAGIIRNGEIVASVDEIVAFWDGTSRGTKNTIDRALNAPHIQRVTVIK